MDEQRLQAIEARATNRTQGEFMTGTVDVMNNMGIPCVAGTVRDMYPMGATVKEMRAIQRQVWDDAQFIGHAYKDIPDLCAALREEWARRISDGQKHNQRINRLTNMLRVLEGEAVDPDSEICKRCGADVVLDGHRSSCIFAALDEEA